MSFDAARHGVWRVLADPGGAPADAFTADVAAHVSRPTGRLEGREAVLAALFRPLDAGFGGRGVTEPHLLLAGHWHGATWVAATGVVRGAWRGGVFGLPRQSDDAPSALRFGAFFRITEAGIAEIRWIFDLPGLLAQLGRPLLPPWPLPMETPPGPIGWNGIRAGEADPAETAKTLQLVEDMLSGCNRLEGADLASMGMAAFWHQDMVWHGPWGIGSAHGFQAFQDHAQGPSVAAFPNRRGGFHQARIAEGVTAAFTGWPSLQGTFNGAPFHGLAPTGGEIGMNLMDFYVRRGDKLLENWVVIDLIDFWGQCGVNVLEGLDAA